MERAFVLFYTLILALFGGWALERVLRRTGPAVRLLSLWYLTAAVR